MVVSLEIYGNLSSSRLGTQILPICDRTRREALAAMASRAVSGYEGDLHIRLWLEAVPSTSHNCRCHPCRQSVVDYIQAYKSWRNIFFVCMALKDKESNVAISAWSSLGFMHSRTGKKRVNSPVRNNNHKTSFCVG